MRHTNCPINGYWNGFYHYTFCFLMLCLFPSMHYYYILQTKTPFFVLCKLKSMTSYAINLALKTWIHWNKKFAFYYKSNEEWFFYCPFRCQEKWVWTNSNFLIFTNVTFLMNEVNSSSIFFAIYDSKNLSYVWLCGWSQEPRYNTK